MMLLNMGRAIRRLREVLAIAIVATWCSSASAVGLTYVDAADHLGTIPGSPYLTGNDQNIFAASGAPLGDVLNANGTASNFTDGLWAYRLDPANPGANPPVPERAYGARGTIYETQNEAAPALYQRISGLTPGAFYDVYVAYWSDTNNWAIRAGTSSVEDSNPIFDRTGALGTQGYPALYSAFDVLPQDNYFENDEDGLQVLTQTQNAVTLEGNRHLLLGPAGLNLQANASGQIDLYIDDVSSVSSTRTWFDGVAYAPAGTPVSIYAEIDRTTGNVTLHNPTSQDFRVARYALNSATASLDPTDWITIAGNTDGAGNSTRDSDIWTVTNPNPLNAPVTRSGQLREIETGEVVNEMTILDSNGALIPANTSINLGNVWVQSPFEDVIIEMATLLNNEVGGNVSPSSAVRIPVRYINGTKLDLGDFDYDGDIDLDDYQTLLTNMNRSFASITIGEAYRYGDLNRDRATGFADLVEFAALYDAANGAGSFALATGTRVPEPGTLAVMGIAAVAMGLGRYRRRLASTAVALLACLVGASTASAQAVTYIDAEPSNTVLEEGGAMMPSTDATGNVLLLAAGSNNTDGKWTVRPFGNQSTAPWGPVAANPNFTVFEGGGTENVDRLVTTFALPDTQIYKIYAFIWDDQPGTGWDADIQLGDGPVQSFVPLADGVSFEAANLPQPITGMTATLVPGIGAMTGDPLHDIDQPNGMPGNRNLYAAPLGVWSGEANGLNVKVSVDTGGTAERTWYDGVGYAINTDPLLVIRVNRSTGEVRIENNYAGAVDLSYYEINSASGSLNRLVWNSLDEQNIGATSGGGLLDGWDETGSDVRPGDFNADGSVDAADYVVWRNNQGAGYTVQDYVDWKANYGESGPYDNATVLSEVNLFGVTSIAANSSISLGNIYNTAIDGQDLQFRYGLVADGSTLQTFAFYTGSPGALVATANVPEPSTWALGLLAGVAVGGIARKRKRA